MQLFSEPLSQLDALGIHALGTQDTDNRRASIFMPKHTLDGIGRKYSHARSLSLTFLPIEIESFCQLNFGVTFPLMAKIDVNGDKEDPVYTFLKAQKAGLLGMTRIKWNFEKFLIGKDGLVHKRYSSIATPESIAVDVENLLKA